MGNINIAAIYDPGVRMYLTVIDQILIKYRGIMKLRPTEKFDNFVRELVVNHVIDGEEPPLEIQSAVLNIADDILSGREVTIRAGDYISLMNYAKEMKSI